MRKNDGFPLAPDELEGAAREHPQPAVNSRDAMLSSWAACAQRVDDDATPLPAASFDMPPERPELGRRGWAIVAFAAIEALLCSFVFDPRGVGASGSVPGLGLTVLMLLGFVAAYVCLGKRAHLTATSIAFTAASLAFSLTPTLFGGAGSLLLLNSLAAWFTGTYTLYLLSGQCTHRPLSISAVGSSLLFFVTGLFTNWSLPIKALTASFRMRRDGTKRRATGVGLGVIIALCLLAVVIVPLLASAALVFESMVTRVLDALLNLQIGDVAWHVAFTLVAGPFMFGLLWGLVHGTGVAPAREGTTVRDELSAGIAARCRPAALIVVLVALGVVYALFAWIQFRYLFSGTEAVYVHGGYAAYARSGFFQLCAITVINSAVILLSAQVAHRQGKAAGGKNSAMRVLTCLLVALTAVILASAIMRMLLYVSAYGLSILRLLTLFIMAFEAVVLVALLVKTFCARANFFAVFFVGAVVFSLAFAYVNPSAVIANYNVDSFIAGNTRELDLDYLTENLSSDATGAIEKLGDYLEEHPEHDLYQQDYADYDDEGNQLPAPKRSELVERALRNSEQARQHSGDVPWTHWHRDLPGAGMYADSPAD